AVAAERSDPGGGVAGELEHLRIAAGGAEIRRPRDVETFHPALAGVDVRAGLTRQRLTIAVVPAADDVEHGRRVAHAPRERTDVRDVIPPREADADRHATVRGLDANEPAERRRNADRPAAVRSERDRATPGCHRGRRPAPAARG